MPRTEARTVFFCSSCGNEQAKWFGRCPACDAWNTAQEAPRATAPRAGSTSGAAPRGNWARHSTTDATPVPLTEGTAERPEERRTTGLLEFDRVLGGGVVPGSVVLIGGDPGIGKSTLLLQTAAQMARAGSRVLYVSGEESVRQIQERAKRLDALDPGVLLLAATEMTRIGTQIESTAPTIVVADSIQSFYSEAVGVAPGSLGQVRACAFELVQRAKSSDIAVFLVGHVTKEGEVAGPRVLEHMVDAVLYMEGERYHELRVLRAQKNRFGATTEIGLFEMTERGFRDVPEPSAVLLTDRRPGVPGSVVAATLDGSRALLVEVQALTAGKSGPHPQRRVTGLSPHRLQVILGVLAVRGGIPVVESDVFVSVTGGMRIDETAVDLAACLAVASSAKQTPVPDDLVVIGEVGLGGEIRRVVGGERRLIEAAKIGFRRAMLPASMAGKAAAAVPGMELIPVTDLRQALARALGPALEIARQQKRAEDRAHDDCADDD